ncbi:MAG: acetyl-CoA carboxylase, biotin carboxyl carrier protein [Naasia sp.]|nr:acetyl-CoA carboxylase, biotin carboxyl carrier protein [Naasia sp.]
MSDAEPVTWDQILRLVSLLDDGELTEASIRFGDVTVEVSKGGPLTGSRPEASRPVPSPAASPAGASAPVAAGADAVLPSPGTPVPAPIIGVFYRASSPGADPFAVEGDDVDADRTIGIIEMMKMMNPVTAGVSGRLLGFAVADGQAVEFGQPLAYIDEAL